MKPKDGADAGMAPNPLPLMLTPKPAKAGAEIADGPAENPAEKSGTGAAALCALAEPNMGEARLAPKAGADEHVPKPKLAAASL